VVTAAGLNEQLLWLQLSIEALTLHGALSLPLSYITTQNLLFAKLPNGSINNVIDEAMGLEHTFTPFY
jgi:hypothetical protein